MKRRAARILVLLWFGWYLTGPLCETIDFWDTPREEMHDVMFHAGGGVTLLAAVLCFGMVVFRKLRERCSNIARAMRLRIQPLSLSPILLSNMAVAAPAHSPPSILLRI